LATKADRAVQIGAVILLLITSRCAYVSMHRQSDPAYGRQVDLANGAQSRLLPLLKDSDSAKFGRTFVGSDKGDPMPQALCGWVNAKNAFGAYVGFRRFIVPWDEKALPLIDDDEGSLVFNEAWLANCSNTISEAS
jgi:hypothetical protein